MTDRTALVTEARRWIGTPYRHCGDIHGVGTDCAMLLVAVYRAVGLIPADTDPRPYPTDWHLHQREERYVGIILSLGAREISQAAALPGDIAVWKVGNCYAHGGIITGRPGVTPPTGWPWVVHAYRAERIVVESNAALAGIMADEKHPRRYFTMLADGA